MVWWQARKKTERADPHLSVVITWLEGEGDRTSRAEVQGTSQVTRNLLVQWNRLQLMEREWVLYHLWESEDGNSTRSQLVIPRHLIPNVLKALHDAPTAGHLGTMKTAAKIRERFYWSGLQADVENWRQQYPKCVNKKPTMRVVRAPLASSHAGYALERAHGCWHSGSSANHSGRQQVHYGREWFSRNGRRRTPSSTSRKQKQLQSKWLINSSVTLGCLKSFTQTKDKHRIQVSPRDVYAAWCTQDPHYNVSSTARRAGGEIRWPACCPTTSQKTTRTGLYTSPRSWRHTDPASTKRTNTHTKYVANPRNTLEQVHERAVLHLKVAQRKQKDYYDLHAFGEPCVAGDSDVWPHVPAIKKGQATKFATS